jgi:hypothetical protein
MSIALDDFDYDYERSRAAVAVACLRWLRCTGPAIDAEAGRGGGAGLPGGSSPIEAPAFDPDDWPHPLWDLWIDG